MSDSSVGVTPGSGKDIASYKITEGGKDKEIQRNALNDASGALLAGQKARALSLPVTLSPQDLAELLATDPAIGFVEVPTMSGTPLTEATRGIVITAAGNLAVKMSNGSDNNSKPIPVAPGMTLPFRVVQLTAANTAGVLGLR